MFIKCLASGSVVGGVIVLAAVSYGCQMGLKEPEFGWMAGIVVAGLGVCAGLLVFLVFLIVGLLAKVATSQIKPPSGQAAAAGPPDIKSEQAGAGEPATRSESDSEGSDKPQPDAEGRSR
jgi:hypothetical protein